MAAEDLREKIKSEIASVDAAALLPHHRRGALLMLSCNEDMLEVAVAIATDDSALVATLLGKQALTRPTLGELADWCVDPAQRFQFVILQPYVLAQALPRASAVAT